MLVPATNAPVGLPTAATSFSNQLVPGRAKFGPCLPTAPRLTSSLPKATTSRPTGRPSKKTALELPGLRYLGRNFPSAARITMFGCYISPEFCFLLLLFTVILSYLFVSDV